MAFPKSFTKDPYTPLTPNQRWFPNTDLGETPLPPLVKVVREKVSAWRESGYEGASSTTKRLLNYWFMEDHILQDGAQFRYYFAQRDSVESVIYLKEIAKVKNKWDLLEKFNEKENLNGAMFPEDWIRYVIKMATGSGKTKVMSLIIAWSYFNKYFGEVENLSTNFLLIAPNVIVFERLKEDFENGKIFITDPIIPPEYKDTFNLNVILQDNPSSVEGYGNLYLTNIQRLYEREEKSPENPVQELLGQKPNKNEIEFNIDTLIARISSHNELMVLNDEAHHIHNPKLAWSNVIQRIHDALNEHHNGLTMQIDFSATPKDQNGQYFPHIIVNYPLVEAIEQNIVKRPILPTKASTAGFEEMPVENAVEKYNDWIQLGIARWRDYRNRLAEVNKKPILFIMTENTKASKEITDYLETIDDLQGKVLRIDTNPQGDLLGKNIDELRKASREIDANESPYSAIVSVVMLREGWDVKNVTVIVGLRPYTAKSNILPEQTVGRGLRKMYRDNPAYLEKLDVIGTTKFEEFVRNLSREEGVEFKEEDFRKPVELTTIKVETAKADRFDIEIPVLTPSLIRDIKDLSQLSLSSFDNFQPMMYVTYSEEELKEIIYEDAVTGEESERFKHRTVFPRNSTGIISYFTNRILQESRCQGQFDKVAPIVKEVMKYKLFGREVNLDDRNTIRNLANTATFKNVKEVFVNTINKLTTKTTQVTLEGRNIKVSDTPSYESSEEVCSGRKTVFNAIPYQSGLEEDFCNFLDEAEDVVAYVKNDIAGLNYKVEYLNKDGNIKFYYPDFFLEDTNGNHYVVETKGLEDTNVKYKDLRIKEWVADVSTLTGQRWEYIKVNEKGFREYHPCNLQELSRLNLN